MILKVTFPCIHARQAFYLCLLEPFCLIIFFSALISIFKFQDEKDLVRSLASAMESTEGTEGDEYLHPKRHPHGTSGLTSVSSGSGSSPQTPVKNFWPAGSSMTSDGSCAPQNRHNWNQELLRYAQAAESIQSENGTGTLSSDGSTRRYCSDPLKMLVKDDSEDCFDSGISKSSQAQVAGLKLELPLDEDDYLMPSPQQNQQGTAYIDLIGDSKHADVASTSGYRTYPDFLPHIGQTNIDNPEYIMSQEPVPTQTIGIPTSEIVQVTVPENSVQNQQAYQPQRSSEEESDHEYYNDFDRLQRELQPLRKNETTV